MLRFVLLMLFALHSLSVAAAPLDEWVKIGDDYNRDISGLVMLGETAEGPVMLVAHDNKYEDEDRIARVTIRGDSVEYQPFSWPEGVKKPVDIEAMTFAPDRHGLYITTSRGDAAWIAVDYVKKAVTEVKRFVLEVPEVQRPQIEGLQVVELGGKTWIVWGHRGSDGHPAILHWGSFDEKTLTVTPISSTYLHVPWPTISEVRHLSDLHITLDGTLYISSASEASNDGPFDGALYKAGKFTALDDNLRFQVTPLKEALKRFPGRKVEGFDRTKEGIYFLGTDDENLGSFVIRAE
ncbi:hypothetical protein KQI63_15170 [bacterium]|nr:hypothetical protein [bacterium]